MADARSPTYLLRGDGISLDAPAIAEAIRQLKNGQHELALRSTPFVQPGLERHPLDLRRVAGTGRQVAHSTGGIRLASPTVSAWWSACTSSRTYDHMTVL